MPLVWIAPLAVTVVGAFAVTVVAGRTAQAVRELHQSILHLRGVVRRAVALDGELARLRESMRGKPSR